MKQNIVSKLLITAVLALGIASAVLLQKVRLQRAELERVRADLVSAEKRGSAAETRAAAAERQLGLIKGVVVQATTAVNATEHQITELQESLAEAKAKAAESDAPPLGRILNDPQMKELMKSQQALTTGPLMEKQYAAFFKQASLGEEKTLALKDLLKRKLLTATGVGIGIGGETDPAKRADAIAQIQREKDALNAQIKQVLGDDKYQALQDYEKTSLDRLAVTQFHDEVAAGSLALSPEQEEALVQAVNEERLRFKPTGDDNQNQGEGKAGQPFDQKRVDQWAADQEQFDQIALERARKILSPEQTAEFEQFQKRRRDIQTTGMKMAAKMMGSKN